MGLSYVSRGVIGLGVCMKFILRSSRTWKYYLYQDCLI